MSFSWTEEKVELLRKLWMEGIAASAIAQELGEGVTRNAVIGKVHRLKIAGTAGPRPERASRKKSDTPRLRKTTTKALAPAQRAAVRTAARAFDAHIEAIGLETEIIEELPFVLPPTEHTGGVPALMGRKENQCRWPIGDTRDDNFRLCGCQVETPKNTYCDFHHAKAYQKEEPRRRNAVRSRSFIPRQIPNFF